ncbi:hypothetical protein FE810_04020 [Thalassotalea litorea]|uniref:Ion channel protein Tsx n=1 Tax=Thalassotalea litorea TaxID=2020715 RepID=A0A5R9IXN0_9GAMM|nr:outer membrane protein OmpK [Thalassotalea litorea]TLU66688.1 hypothetical protein FE810_04020 [Thalassotalea litorea]
MLRILSLLTGILFSALVHADYQFGFANTYFDYLSWNQGTQGYNGIDVSEDRDDHVTWGIEAGVTFDWGEAYGFMEAEKLDKSADVRSQAFKVSAHYRLGGEWTVYGQVYDYSESGGFVDEQNRVLGLGYLGISTETYWFKPFLGLHHVTSPFNDPFGNNISGFNGGMLGWNLGAFFSIGAADFMFTHWNEIEFARNSEYADYQNGDTGLNGAIALWYDISKHVYVGIQYRYFANKLGVDDYGDAIIWRIGAHF